MVHIYTDGSSLGNPGAGGRAAVIHGKKKHALSGFVSHATNNAMELRAVIEALLWIAQQYEVTIPVQQTGTGFFAQSSGGASGVVEQAIIIHTDSTYVQQGVTQWLATRVRRDRRRSKGGQKIANMDLRQYLHALLPLYTQLDRRWVKAHAGHAANEEVDRLARRAAMRQ